MLFRSVGQAGAEGALAVQHGTGGQMGFGRDQVDDPDAGAAQAFESAPGFEVEVLSGLILL